jgi:hypothetical protein
MHSHHPTHSRVAGFRLIAILRKNLVHISPKKSHLCTRGNEQFHIFILGAGIDCRFDRFAKVTLESDGFLKILLESSGKTNSLNRSDATSLTLTIFGLGRAFVSDATPSRILLQASRFQPSFFDHSLGTDAVCLAREIIRYRCANNLLTFHESFRASSHCR